MKDRRSGFTLLELLLIVAIVAILAAVVIAILFPSLQKTRDARRKAEISEIGKLLTAGCYVPDAGAGEYDLLIVLGELQNKYPQYQQWFSQVPRDPKSGTESESFYRYSVSTTTGRKCAVYANLENENEKVTLQHLSAPTPGGGTGVFEATSTGWNGSGKYFQFSN